MNTFHVTDCSAGNRLDIEGRPAIRMKQIWRPQTASHRRMLNRPASEQLFRLPSQSRRYSRPSSRRTPVTRFDGNVRAELVEGAAPPPHVGP